MLEQAVQSPDTATFGIVGVLIVLASATSLSRALTRAYAAIWHLPRPKSNLRSAWRWLAVVVTLALSLIVVRAVSGYAAEVPPGNVWQRVVAFICDVAIAVFVPWLLLTGAVRLRLLVPGAMIFALVMVGVRPASAVWLPRALEVSADRYGSIGVAFTYLAWLYVVSFCVLADGCPRSGDRRRPRLVRSLGRPAMPRQIRPHGLRPFDPRVPRSSRSGRPVSAGPPATRGTRRRPAPCVRLARGAIRAVRAGRGAR